MKGSLILHFSLIYEKLLKIFFGKKLSLALNTRVLSKCLKNRFQTPGTKAVT